MSRKADHNLVGLLSVFLRRQYMEKEVKEMTLSELAEFIKNKDEKDEFEINISLDGIMDEGGEQDGL